MKKIREVGLSGLSKKIFVLAVISWITLMASLDGHCAVINVPADQPTLQAALAAAIDGDQILLADGTYNGNFTLGSHSITIISENGPDNCILDGNGTGPVLYFHDDAGDGGTCSLTGLAIQNGKGEDTGTGVIFSHG